MIGVLLVDDHALVRAGLRALIERFAEYRVLAEAADGREAVQLARALQPALVLIDIAMPGLNGLDAIAEIRRAAPACKVVVVSMHGGPDYMGAALRAGAEGYVLKDAAPEALATALAAVRAGRRHFIGMSGEAMQGHAQGVSPVCPSVPGALAPELTRRQREILQLIAEGHATREIATCLHISVKTVETHRAQLMQRLGIFDVAGLTRHAIRIGLVSPER
ncbi:MAG: response regulator transcription factor [Rhodocyclaceae bacterium]|jgi:DNA-binding NarL/FixJ family response regulator|nr:response regulator transcription factor [Rhodocyclaceae bacterium]